MAAVVFELSKAFGIKPEDPMHHPWTAEDIKSEADRLDAAERPVDYRIRDLEMRLNAVRAQRDAAVQQSLDHAATIAVLRRKLDQRADGIGYCDSTFTAPDGASYVCALDAGHRANLHRDSSLRYAWDDTAKAAERQDPKWTCGKCERAERLGEDDGQIPEHHRTCPKRGPRSLSAVLSGTP
ncbi:hypothetical protein SEA_PHLOP_63 [Gordonia phage Phlop]|uniref:Uncharacterized protein n=1 Tax=Gordonia phage Phlop TaxID=2805836 RepID=A0A890UN52_9CAUD|nr:hypothetical protein KNV78_gp63 [Gordonia phage Phlop]QRI45025.1 hypothetical protein SEA_PHLOP_63 [Gordonia phage Phlop]UVK63774.1 hypothetical protein SEA_PULLUMCAVEA_64 [Gordonia phage PullumCavea]